MKFVLFYVSCKIESAYLAFLSPELCHQCLILRLITMKNMYHLLPGF